LGGPPAFLELLDDGLHGDGRAGDGIYAVDYLAGEMVGSYAVLGAAEGEDLEGRHFELFTSASFHLLPRALVVFSEDPFTAGSFAELLEQGGFSVDLAPVGAVPELFLPRYSLIVIGPETGNGAEWGTEDAAVAIINSEVPVLGVGDGGYAFFGQFGFGIGYPNGGHSTGTSIAWTNGSDAVWFRPYDIALPVGLLALYTAPNPRVDILIEMAPGATVLGYYDADPAYANLLVDGELYELWGFNAGPEAMTDTGRELFVNAAHRIAR
jgi:hypothetical protein